MRWLMPLRRRERLTELIKDRDKEPATSYLSLEINRAERRLLEGREDLDNNAKIEQRWARLLHSSNDGRALKKCFLNGRLR